MKSVAKSNPLAPTKGVRPQTNGVPGVLVSEAPPEGMLFGAKKLKVSPYDPLLLQLKVAGPGNYLKFEDLRARVSVYARAKKLGIVVEFGERGNTLWVALGKAQLHTDGAVDEAPRKTISDVVIDAIKAKRTTAGEIVTFVRSNGGAGAGITQIDGVLSSLLRQGKVRLVSRPTDDVPRWGLAA